jgi:hypothetical protein
LEEHPLLLFFFDSWYDTICGVYQNGGRAIVKITDTEFLSALAGPLLPQVLVTTPWTPPDGNRPLWPVKYHAPGDQPETVEDRYYCVSTFRLPPDGKPARRRDLFERQFVLVIDDVVEKLNPGIFEYTAPPTYILQSSLGSYQMGWALDLEEEITDAHLEAFHRQFLDRYHGGVDTGQVGVTRVVRLPSSYNCKPSRIAENGGTPWKCELSVWNPGPRYKLVQLASTLQIDLSGARVRERDHLGTDLWPAEAPVMQAIERGDIQVHSEPAPGVYKIRCPNADQHTDDRDADESGLLTTHEDGSGGYVCHHGHCRDNFRFGELLDHLGIKATHDAWKQQRTLETAFRDVPQAPQAPTPAPIASPPDQPAATTAWLPELPPVNLHLEEGAVAYPVSEIADWVKLNTPGMEDTPDKLLEALLFRFKGMSSLTLEYAAAELADNMPAHTKASLLKALKKVRKEFAQKQALAGLEAVPPINRQLGIAVPWSPPDKVPYPIHGRYKTTGEPKPTAENFKLLLDQHNIRVRYNEMTSRTEVDLPNLGIDSSYADYANHIIGYITDICSLSDFNPGVRGIKPIVNQLAGYDIYHPVDEWLNTLPPWDGRDRIQDIPKILNAGGDPQINDIMLRHWFRQLIVACKGNYGMNPPRNVLVLQGDQYAGKTYFWRSMMPEIKDVFKEGINLDPSNKDSVYTATTSMLVELGELDATVKKDVAHLKAFLSNTEDIQRRPYALDDTRRRRRTVFAATVNKPKFLVDQTGNSRFRVIPIGKINQQLLDEFIKSGGREQLWKQLEHEVMVMGLPWNMSYEDNLRVEAYTNELFRDIPMIETVFLDIYDLEAPSKDWRWLSITEIRQEISQYTGKPPAYNRDGLPDILRRHTGQDRFTKKRIGDGKQARLWNVPPRKVLVSSGVAGSKWANVPTPDGSIKH